MHLRILHLGVTAVDHKFSGQYSAADYISVTANTNNPVATRTKKIDFEASISALQELVEKMERGDFTLEESVAQFEHGMALAKNCQQALRDAEVKVSKLSKSAQGELLEPLDDQAAEES